MKKLFILLAFLFVLFPLHSHAIVAKSDVKYVTDEADLITQDAEDYIVKYSEFIYKLKKIDDYVVTVKSLEGMSIEDYTTKVYDSFKLRDRGLLIVVSKDDRKMRVQAGTKLSSIITSELIDEYIDTYFMPYLEREEWNDGIINGYSAFYKYLCEEFEIDASSMEVVDELDFLTKYKTPITFVIVWLCIMFSNAYGKFIKKGKLKKKYPVKQSDNLKLGILLILNIACLSLAYILEPIYLVFVLAFQAITLYSSLNTTKNIVAPQEEKKQKKKTRTRKQTKTYKRVKKR